MLLRRGMEAIWCTQCCFVYKPRKLDGKNRIWNALVLHAARWQLPGAVRGCPLPPLSCALTCSQEFIPDLRSSPPLTRSISEASTRVGDTRQMMFLYTLSLATHLCFCYWTCLTIVFILPREIGTVSYSILSISESWHGSHPSFRCPVVCGPSGFWVL